MATLTLSFTHKVGGVLTNATSVYLSDPTGTFGVKRTDTDAVVVIDGVAMTNASTGVYTYSFTEPASDLTYQYYVEWTYGGVTHHAEFSATGSTSATNLTTLARVKAYRGIPAATTTYDAVLLTLISAASRAVEKYCDRLFLSASRTEYHDGRDTSYLSLDAYPITAVSRIATSPDTALTIQNTDTTTNQLARVSLTASTITLSRTASGTVTTSTLALASYSTITLLAAAVTALGNGWVGTAETTYGKLPPSELRTIQGSLSAIGNTSGIGWGGAELEVYTDELATARIDTEAGTIYGWFPAGEQNIRVDYTGGYSTIPDDLQQAVCAYVSALYNATSIDRTLKSEKIGDYAYTIADSATDISAATLPQLSMDAAMLLAPYRRVHAL